MKTELLQILRQRDEYVSGQELCEHFHVSRTAVWKAVNQLKEAGYEVEAVKNKGYWLRKEPDVLSLLEIQSQRNTKWLGEKIFYYEEVDSTNTMAKKLAEEGAPHGSIVVADLQTMGRGRRGRQWSAPKGEGIWFTMVLKPDILPEKASMLTLVTAVAVVRAVDRMGVEAWIKWPNDVVIRGKKVCGILTEMSAQIDYVNHIVVGVGINVHTKDFDEQISDTATSLELEGAVAVKRAVLLEAVLEEFEDCFGAYMKNFDLSLLLEEYNSHLINCGKRVRVLDTREEYEATALGIDETGELLVKRDDKILRVNSGEVSVRGVYGYV